MSASQRSLTTYARLLRYVRPYWQDFEVAI
jgi:hypothetical protein